MIRQFPIHNRHLRLISAVRLTKSTPAKHSYPKCLEIVGVHRPQIHRILPPVGFPRALRRKRGRHHKISRRQNRYRGAGAHAWHFPPRVKDSRIRLRYFGDPFNCAGAATFAVSTGCVYNPSRCRSNNAKGSESSGLPQSETRSKEQPPTQLTSIANVLRFDFPKLIANRRAASINPNSAHRCKSELRTTPRLAMPQPP